MRKVFLYTVMLCWAIQSHAQEVEHISVSGSELISFITQEGYKYPSFQRGKVFFNNQDSGGGRLNYNYLLQTMQFIDPKGDTLVFADESLVKYVTIGQDTFFYEDGFYEKMAGSGKMKLAKKHFLKGSEPEKLGAFGKPSMTAQVIGAELLRSNTAPIKLDINQEFRFIKQTTFYLSTGKNHYMELSRKTIKDVFPGKADRVNEFIKKNNLKLDKEQDVISLFAFITQLT